MLEVIGNLGDHAVQMVPEGKFKVYFFIDDLRH